MAIREKVRVKNDQEKHSVSDAELRAMFAQMQRNFATMKVASAATAGDPGARAATRSAYQRQEIHSVRGEKIAQSISNNTQSQVQYLASMDMSLKDLKSYMLQQNKQLRQAEAQNVAMRQRLDAKKVSLPPRRKTAPNKISELEKDAGDAFSIGNFIKYGAPLAITAYDAHAGYKKADEWGVNPLIAGIGGMLGGNEKGGTLNAINKASSLGALGNMVGGMTPLGKTAGTIMGMLIGSITGYIGSKDFSKFLQDIIKNLPSAIFEKAKKNFSLNVDHLKANVGDLLEDTWDNLKDMATDMMTTIKKTFTLIYAGLQDKFGDAFKALGAATGLDVLTNAGDWWKNRAQKARDDADKTELEERQAQENAHKMKKAERADRDKARSDRDNKMQQEEKDNTVANQYKKLGGFVPAVLGGNPNHKEGQQPTQPSTSPRKATQAEIKDSAIKSDLTVGDVPGDDIRAAAEAANRMTGKKGDQTEIVAPQALAAIVDQETRGKLNRVVGDGGKSLGITQMGDKSLKDVNDTFGTEFTPEKVKSDYHQALLASALFLKLKMKGKMDLQSAFSAYNGSGMAAKAYGGQVMARLDSIPTQDKTPQLQPPAPNTKGTKIAAATVEVADAKENNKKPAAAPVVAPVTTVTNVNQSSSIQAPMPSTRNEDPTFLDVLYRGYMI